jgi:hypothetical protein
MTTALALVDALPSDPHEALRELRAEVSRGLGMIAEGWRVAGQGLSDIRESGVYRLTHSTFEAFVFDGWGISRRRAYQLIDAAAVVLDLCTVVHMLPESERQARPLTRIESGQRAEVWREVVETAPRTEAGEPRITAAHVESVVQAVEQRQGSGRMSVHYSSDSPEWYTPRHIVDAVVAVLGGIDLDPCSNGGDAPNVPACDHLTTDDDGLAHEWHGRVYMNPPYGDVIGEWTRKLREEHEAGNVTQAIALLPARTDTQWFREMRAYARCFVWGRLRFSDSANSAPFPSVVVYFGTDVKRFARAFADIGDTYALV